MGSPALAQNSFQSTRLEFDGGAGTFLIMVILYFLIISFSFGLAAPWAICLKEDWRVSHTLFNGKRMKFKGTGLGFFGLWIKIWFLGLITLGIYLFWAAPQMHKWIAENTEV